MPGDRRDVPQDHARIRHRPGFELEGDRGRDVRPIQPVTMPHFIGRIAQSFDGHENVREDFVRFERGFALVLSFRSLKELFGGDLPGLALRTGDREGGAEGDERRAKTRRADEGGGAIVAKKGVITVVPFTNQRGAVAQGEKPETVSKIPATWTLAKVAADGADGHDLWTAHAVGRGNQSREMLFDSLVLSHLGQGGRRADAHAFFVDFDALEFRNVAQADHALRFSDVLLERRDEVGAAGQNFRFAPLAAQEAGGFFHRCGSGVFKGFHANLPPFCSAASTRSGVKGSCGTRTPRALATALAMAAPGEMTGGSPSPITPRSS